MFQIGLSLAQAPVPRAESAPTAAHVFVVAGDSVASGRAPETDAEVFPSGARHWAASNAWEPPGSRLHHGPWETGAVARPDASANFGWARAFANAYPAANPGEALRMAAQALVIRELLLQRAGELSIEAPRQDDGGTGE